jgi:hypothetical protein
MLDDDDDDNDDDVLAAPTSWRVRLRLLLERTDDADDSCHGDAAGRRPAATTRS